MHPDTFGKIEMMTLWGFPAVVPTWNYSGFENKPVALVVYSNAEEVEVLVNGQSLGRKQVCMERPMPNSVRFETVYQPGKVEAISYRDGKEISRDMLLTTGTPASIRLLPEKQEMKADGHDLIYVGIELLDKDGLVVPDAAVFFKAEVSGSATLSGFGSGNPITEEDYTKGDTVSYRGRAMAILRAGYESGTVELTVSAERMEAVHVELIVS